MVSKRKVWPLNQAFTDDFGYGAEILRAEHHAATSGGTGVSHPTAMKVVAKQAADNSVLILPGGGTVASPFAGAEGQSYFLPHMDTLELEVAPTGGSARDDVVVMRFADSQYGVFPPGAPQRELTAEEASQFDWFWPEVLQNRSADDVFDFPHLKLTLIRRPANTTFVTNSHMTDLRVLADPQNDVHMAGDNLFQGEEVQLGSTDRVFPASATHVVRIPDFATSMVVKFKWESARNTHVDTGQYAQGRVQVRLTGPDGTQRLTQMSEWTSPGERSNQRFNIGHTDTISVPAVFRGKPVTVEPIGRKYSGSNIWMDSVSSWDLTMFFKQEIA